MNRSILPILVLGLLLLSVFSGWAAEVNPTEAEAVAEIERRGDTVTVDEKSPDRPIIGVDLHRTPWTEDRDQVTDVALQHIEVLTRLQVLQLSGTKVTDAGLEHLKSLTRLQTLSLGRPGLRMLEREYSKDWPTSDRSTWQARKSPTQGYGTSGG